MRTHHEDMRGAAVAAAVAIVGTIALFFIGFDPPGEIQNNGIGMITAAAAQRAEATLLPSEPATRPAARKTSVASN